MRQAFFIRMNRPLPTDISRIPSVTPIPESVALGDIHEGNADIVST